jgi:Ca2+:H+ antiporter
VAVRAVYYLLGLVPVALLLDLAGAPAASVFVVSAVAVVPAAALMGEATEQLAEHSGPGVAGLLNVTFGNAPELIISLFALADGLHEVVKASLVGSVMGNALLVLGAAMLAGGWRRPRQHFHVEAARSLDVVLLLGTGALLVPSIVMLAGGGSLPRVGSERTSGGDAAWVATIVVSLTLIAVYARGLRRSLRSQAETFAGPAAGTEPEWSRRRAGIVLALAAVLVAVVSDTLVGSVEHTSHQLGLSQFFIGAIVVAIVGNAAEHYVAVVAATKDQMDLSLSIAVGSAAQVGLLVAPLVALASIVIGPGRMPLVFNGYELAALICGGGLAAAVTFGGVSTKRRGLVLLAVYLALAVAFLLA